MKISMHALAVETFAPMLRALSDILDKAQAHARDKKQQSDALVGARLAPDMFTLAQQVQQACQYANDVTVQLANAEAPHFENDETTLDALKAHIAKTIDHLQKQKPAAFDGSENKQIVLPVSIPDSQFEMTGFQYLRDWALPHFYFHVVTAYDILRHKGVPIGKIDYLSRAGVYIRDKKKKK
jgi:hypothetical protein